MRSQSSSGTSQMVPSVSCFSIQFLPMTLEKPYKSAQKPANVFVGQDFEIVFLVAGWANGYRIIAIWANEVRIQFTHGEELRAGKQGASWADQRGDVRSDCDHLFSCLAASAGFLAAQAIDESLGRAILRVILDTFDLSLLT